MRLVSLTKLDYDPYVKSKIVNTLLKLKNLGR